MFCCVLISALVKNRISVEESPDDQRLCICAWNFGDDKDVPLKSRGVLAQVQVVRIQEPSLLQPFAALQNIA